MGAVVQGVTEAPSPLQGRGLGRGGVRSTVPLQSEKAAPSPNPLP